MLNNGGQSQNDAYSGIQGFHQYGQNMTSTLNAPQAGYGAQPKRPSLPLMQQGMQQQGMAGVRQAAQRPAMQQQRYTNSQYPANRAVPGPQQPAGSNSIGGGVPQMRQGQPQYASSGMTVPSTATTATGLHVRTLGQQNPHANMATNTIPGDISFLLQQQGGMQYSAHQQQAQQLHGVQQQAQQHPAQRVKAERRAPLGAFETVGSHQPSHPMQQLQPDAAGFARYNSRVVGTVAVRKQMPGRPDGVNGQNDSLLDASDFPALGGAAAAMGRGSTANDVTMNFSALHLSGMQASAATGGKKLDTSDFPSLGGLPRGAAALNGLTMPVRGIGGRVGGAAAPGDLPSGRSDDERFLLTDLLPLCPGHRRRDDPEDRQFLSVGLDVETLGLNLCSGDDVHPMLASPWAVGGHGGETDVRLPTCYVFDPPQVTSSALMRFALGSVMFVFYAFAGAPLPSHPPAPMPCRQPLTQPWEQLFLLMHHVLDVLRICVLGSYKAGPLYHERFTIVHSLAF
jgi:hypothetical protein